MRDKSSDKGLYELIHSLTPTEKRYFQLELREEGRAQVTKDVFQSFLKMESPEEEATFVKQRQIQAAPSNFSATKYQVTERILRSMRAFHAKATVDARLRSMLDDISFLHRKGLWDLFQKRLRKADRLARQFERFRIQLELLQWERQLIFHRAPKDLQAALHELDLRCESLFLSIRADNLAETLHTGILAMSKKNTRLQAAEEIKALQILLGPLAELKDMPQHSFFTRLSILNVKGLGDFLLGKYESAFGYFEKALAAWRERPKMLALHLDHFRISLTNFANCCFFLDRLGDLHTAMAFMSQLPDLPPMEQLQFETTRYHLDLMHHLNMARFGDAHVFLPQLKAWISANKNAIQPARLKLLQYNAALLNFMADNHSGTLQWLEPILTSSYNTQREDINDFAHCLELMVHMELGNWGIVHSRHRSLQRRGKGKNWREGFLRELLVFFREVEKSEGEWKGEGLENALEKMEEIMERPGRLPFGMQETVFWMESKRKGVPLRKFMEEMAAARS